MSFSVILNHCWKRVLTNSLFVISNIIKRFIYKHASNFVKKKKSSPERKKWVNSFHNGSNSEFWVDFNKVVICIYSSSSVFI